MPHPPSLFFHFLFLRLDRDRLISPKKVVFKERVNMLTQRKYSDLEILLAQRSTANRIGVFGIMMGEPVFELGFFSYLYFLFCICFIFIKPMSIASSTQVTTQPPQKAFDQATFSSYIGQTVSGTAVYAGRVNPVSLCVLVCVLYIHKHARPVFSFSLLMMVA